MIAEERDGGIERERKRRERKVSDSGTVGNVYQIYYNLVLLILNTELNSRDPFIRNLILKVAEYQSTRHIHTHTSAHSLMRDSFI